MHRQWLLVDNCGLQSNYGFPRIGHLVSVAFFLGLLTAGGPSGLAENRPLSALPPAPFTFVGQWSCQGKLQSGKPHEATFTGNVILSRQWLELTEIDTVPANGYAAKYLIGFDPEHKRLTEFDANTFAAGTYSSTKGWIDGVLTMTSEISGGPRVNYAINRFIYSVVGNDTFNVDWQISKTVESHWATADHLTCKRRL